MNNDVFDMFTNVINLLEKHNDRLSAIEERLTKIEEFNKGWFVNQPSGEMRHTYTSRPGPFPNSGLLSHD